MTLTDLSNAVLELVPKAARVDVTLCLRTCSPPSYSKETVEVLAEISVWHGGQYYGLDAPTYEQALANFKAELLTKIFPVKPEPVAPAMERLAAMEPEAPIAALSNGDYVALDSELLDAEIRASDDRVK